VNPNNPRQLVRLTEAIRQSNRRLRPFRENYFQAVEHYVGSRFGEVGMRRTYANFIELAVNIYRRHLAARNPHATITTPNIALKPTAYDFQTAVNERIKEINLVENLRMGVTYAMFSPLGLMKVGLERAGYIEAMGFLHDVAQPFADPVLFDDWVMDMTATSMEAVQFCGNRYRLPIDVVKEEPTFNKTARGKVTGTDTDNEGPDDEYHVKNIARGLESYSDEYQDHVTLWDIWLPAERLVVTLASDDSGEFQDIPPLRIVEWEGPDDGPYHLLRFHEVPGSPLGLPPVALWYDMHILANNLFRKMGHQAEREKDILLVRGAAKQDAQRVLEASDGDAIHVEFADDMKEQKFGGVDPATLAFFIQMKNLFTYMAGNLDALGGLSPQAETLGQDQMLRASASQRLADMQDQVITWTRGIVHAIAWYIWQDPLIRVRYERKIEGTDIVVPGEFSSETKKGDFSDFKIDVQPFSMRHEDPTVRLNLIRSIWHEDILGAIQLLTEQGGAPNIKEYLKLVAEYANLPELQYLVNFDVPRPNEMPQPAGPQQPAGGKRIYERVSRPGGTPAGRENALVNLLLGAQLQQGQARQLAEE